MPRNFYQVAILVDAGYLLHKLNPLIGHRDPRAEEIIEFAGLCLRADEERLFRIYFYDCPPLEGVKENPVTKLAVNFGNSTLCKRRKSLHDTIAKSDHIAFRQGILQFNGWSVPDKNVRDIVSKKRPLTSADVVPQIRQKRVDMKIGLDVAWLASKGIVDKIVLITADTDFIPAMKFARREGVQVIVAIPDRAISQDMLHHADEFRVVKYPPTSAPPAP